MREAVRVGPGNAVITQLDTSRVCFTTSLAEAAGYLERWQLKRLNPIREKKEINFLTLSTSDD